MNQYNDTSQMRILWVKMGGLWPINTGGRLRSYNILKQLARRHRVTVLTTHGGPNDDPDQLQVNLPPGTNVESFPYVIPKRTSLRFVLRLIRSWFSQLPVDLEKFRVPALSNRIQQAIDANDVDLVIVDFMSATPNMPTWDEVPTVFFSHNVEYMIWKRLSRVKSLLLRPLLELEWRKMRRCEAKVCNKAAVALTVSGTDQQLFSSIAPDANLAVVPTGVDTEYFTLGDKDDTQPRMVFSGSMDWQPNEDAMIYFCDHILPKIRQKIPDATLTVVGRNPSQRLRDKAVQVGGVDITGTVDDIRPHIASAAIYIVPLRIGGGTRLKIFEALAMGKAVVSTTIGSEGLPLVSGKHIILADRPEHFANEVISLINNPLRRRALGAAGRQLVEKQYAWPKVALEFESKCYEAVTGYSYIFSDTNSTNQTEQDQSTATQSEAI